MKTPSKEQLTQASELLKRIQHLNDQILRVEEIYLYSVEQKNTYSVRLALKLKQDREHTLENIFLPMFINDFISEYIENLKKASQALSIQLANVFNDNEKSIDLDF